jgi:proline iminopeptidase
MRLTINDTQLYFDVDGPQLTMRSGRLVERPTIVVLHGGPGFDQGYLRPGLAPLSAWAQLLFVDLRGQGRSGRPPVPTCTLEQMADDVAALCARLDIASPIVLGHSAGGFVALHLALRHPDAVGGLVLCSTSPTLAPLPDQDPPPSLAQRTSAEAAEVARRMFGGDCSPTTMDAFHRLVAPAYAGPRHQDLPGRLFPLSGFEADVATHFFTQLASSYDVRPRLAEIAAPTLVIVGRYDWVCPPAGSHVLAAGIPGARLVEIADAGHLAYAEEPTAFQAAVVAFVEAAAGVTAPTVT